MNKRISTLLLALCMVLSLATVTVFADEAPEAKWGASADALTEAGTLKEAIAAQPAYIQLQKDITSDAMITFGDLGQDLTIDLNGKTVTINKGQGFCFKTTDGYTATFTDTKPQAEWGSVKGTVGGHGIIFINATAGINVNVTVNAGNYEDVTAMVKVNAPDYAGTITLAGGNFVSTGTNSTAGLAYIKSGKVVLDENFTYTVAAPRDFQLYYSATEATVDLTGHADPTIVSFQTYKNTAARSTIILPAGYGLFDANGAEITEGNLACADLNVDVYTVKAGGTVAEVTTEATTEGTTAESTTAGTTASGTEDTAPETFDVAIIAAVTMAAAGAAFVCTKKRH